MSPTHFNPETLCSTRHIKSAKIWFCCRKPERPQLTIWNTWPPPQASGVGSAEDITARKANQLARTNTHAGPHAHTRPRTHTHTDPGGRQQSPCHLRLRPAHVRPATPHTQLSGPRPPWCPTAASERLPGSYFSSAEQTQKSVCLKSMESCRKNVLIRLSAVGFNLGFLTLGQTGRGQI